MDDHIPPHAGKNDPVVQLRALQQTQSELWTVLRREDDPDTRMSLLSQFSENRALIERLTQEVGEGSASPDPGSERFRVELVETAAPHSVEPQDGPEIDLQAGSDLSGTPQTGTPQTGTPQTGTPQTGARPAGAPEVEISLGDEPPPDTAVDEVLQAEPISAVDDPFLAYDYPGPGFLNPGDRNVDGRNGATDHVPNGSTDPVEPDAGDDEPVATLAEEEPQLGPDPVIDLTAQNGVDSNLDPAAQAEVTAEPDLGPIDYDLTGVGPAVEDQSSAGRGESVDHQAFSSGIDDGAPTIDQLGVDSAWGRDDLVDVDRYESHLDELHHQGPVDERFTASSMDTSFGSGAPYEPESEAPALTGQHRSIQPRSAHPKPGPVRSKSASDEDPPYRALGLLGGLLAVLAVAWLVLGGGGDDGNGSEEANVAADLGEVDPAAPSADDQVAGIVDVLRGMGFVNVGVERRGDTIILVGTVPTNAEREAAIGASQALAAGDTVDASGLLVDEVPVVTAPAAEPSGRAATLQSEINRVVASTPIIFGVEQTDLSELHLRILNSIAGVMQSYPDLPVTIVGFTDDTGSAESNRQISLDRANSVKNYLVSQGVPETNLGLDAQGEDTSTGSQVLANLERRVEFVVAPEAVQAPVAAATPLRVAIVAPSARNDLAFTQSMVDAVGVIAAQRGNVEIAVTDSTFVPEEAAAAIRGYAAEDYDLVIAHGSQFGALLVDIAQEFPDVAFAWGTASDTFGLPNVYAYDAAAEQGGFVMGAMASLLSATGVVGVVGPIEVGDAQRYVAGFRNGATSERPDANVLVTYTGSFSDLTLAAEAAQLHIASGADVLTGSAQMVVGAVSVVNDAGALWFGTQANQSSLAPSQVVASQVYHWEVILAQIVADIDGGVLGGRTYTAALANGGLVIEFNPDVALPEPVRQRADQIIAGVTDGSIVPAVR